MALDVLNQIGDMANVVTYNSVLHALSKGGACDEAVELLNRMKTEGRVDVRCGRLWHTEANSMPLSCSDRGERYVNTLSYQPFHSACAMATLHSVELCVDLSVASCSSEPSLLLLLHLAIMARGVVHGFCVRTSLCTTRQANTRLHTSAAKASSGSLQQAAARYIPSLATVLLSHLPALASLSCPFKADVISYTTVIGGLGKTGEWRKALRLFDVMQSAGIEPNGYTYGAAIAACAQVSTKRGNCRVSWGGCYY